MKIDFLNSSDKTVIICIDSQQSKKIEPHNKISLFCEQKEETVINVQVDEESHIQKGKYVLEIKTKYSLYNLKENVTFNIAREKIRISADVYFERLFLNSDEDINYTECHCIYDEESIKRIYNKKQKTYLWLVSPIEDFTGILLALIVLGVFLFKRIGVINTILYFCGSYLFLVFLSWIGEKLSDTVFKKLFKKKSDKQAFYNCFDSKFIFDYYADSDRIPVMDEIERDGFTEREILK